MIDLAQHYRYGDFTRAHYRALLASAKPRYTFRTYRDFKKDEPFLLWRHDVDMSMHAALALARIEAEEGIKATYFLQPGGSFYNLFEPAILRLIAEIRALGHAFGLHFDHTKYAIRTAADLEKYLQQEKKLLTDFAGVEIDAFSFHNPDAVTQRFEAESYTGLVNCYSAYFKNDVPYCSDSNGYWRHHPLKEMLGAAPRLQVLTHPEWWTETAMSPRARVVHAIDGRAQAALGDYNQLLANAGRENVSELAAEFSVLEKQLGAAALRIEMLWLSGEKELAFLALWRRANRTYPEGQTITTQLAQGKNPPAAELLEGMTAMVRSLTQGKA